MKANQKPYIELPSCGRLNELFVVVGETLTWKARGAKPAGRGLENGYIQVQVDGVRYMAHRIVFKMVSGNDPGKLQIDHIDRNKKNNSPSNLRLATNAQNKQNTVSANRNSKSGIRGVSWDNGKKKWRASIKVDGKTKYIGRFFSASDAEDAHTKARIKLFGEFVPACVTGESMVGLDHNQQQSLFAPRREPTKQDQVALFDVEAA